MTVELTRPLFPAISIPSFLSPFSLRSPYSCFRSLHSLPPLSLPFLFLFLSTYIQLRGLEALWSPASERFWCILTLKLNSFPLAYWSVFMSYFIDFITNWCFLICLFAYYESGGENNSVALVGFWLWKRSPISPPWSRCLCGCPFTVHHRLHWSMYDYDKYNFHGDAFPARPFVWPWPSISWPQNWSASCTWLDSLIDADYGITGRTSARLSVPSIDSSNGDRRVCCWAPFGQEMAWCGRRAAGAGAQQQMRAASLWQPTEEAEHRLVSVFLELYVFRVMGVKWHWPTDRGGDFLKGEPQNSTSLVTHDAAVLRNYRNYRSESSVACWRRLRHGVQSRKRLQTYCEYCARSSGWCNGWTSCIPVGCVSVWRT